MRRLLTAVGVGMLWALASAGQGFQPQIPRVWDDASMAELELPLASGLRPEHVPSRYYYAIPERPVWKSYPVYAPAREPAGYFERLKTLEPERAFDAKALRTREDWIRAGRQVFESANTFPPVSFPFTEVHNPAWWRATGALAAKDGTLPYYRYVIREKGRVELTFDSCASCHSRVLPDGEVIWGGPGSIAFGRQWAHLIRSEPVEKRAQPAWPELTIFFAAPWIQPDPQAGLRQWTMEDMARQLDSIPRGVLPRQGTSILYPSKIPDLIGIKDRRYLDNTGLQQHRSIADLMRYAAINNFIEEITLYGKFRPVGELPPAGTLLRSSDEDLYALALFLYSLEAPRSPYPRNGEAARGEKVFEREGCGTCHPAPLYTNNKLTPAKGFRPPADHRKKYDVMDVVVGTDSSLAMTTRRGTGYYRVPSLKGVWYRGPFEHNGSVATLEDWFDERRLSPDYVPTGYKGPRGRRAVLGHEYGLRLKADEKRALIAFLRTL
ncbi:MAG: hypothetical protein SFV54_20205 [Bryobacteraceae bacterium]|nr:hypothetical protein [Bryobacteraceae bacterium]